MTERVSFEGHRDIRWLSVGGTLITYLREDVPFDDALWDRWLTRVQLATTVRLIIACWGAIQPTHQQWRRANKIMRARELAVACVTENRHSLALVKAASWVGTNVKGYSWYELHDACEFVGVPTEQQLEVKAKIPALRDVLGRVAADVTIGRPTQPRAKLFGEVSYSSEDIQRNLDELQAQLRALRKPEKAANEPAPEPTKRPATLGLRSRT